jgi:hypothetical protein
MYSWVITDESKFPCLILLTDTLELEKYNTGNTNVTVPVPLNKTDIAWTTDKTVKFKNPPGDPLSSGKFGHLLLSVYMGVGSLKLVHMLFFYWFRGKGFQKFWSTVNLIL